MYRYKIGIVGCGTAGAASALFLSRLGHTVSIFERVPQPKAVGAGILMQPTGMTALHRLGELPEILKYGHRVDRIYGQTPKGRPVLDAHYQSFTPGMYGVGLHRGVLFKTLFDAVQTEGISLLCGVEMVDIEGDYLRDNAGIQHGPFNLIIIADGARSQMRATTKIPCQVTRYPWGAIWFVAENLEGQYAGTLSQVYKGVKKMVGFLPTGHTHEDKTPLISLFWSLRLADYEQWQKKGINTWKKEILAMAPAAESILNQIDDQSTLPLAKYYDVKMSQWHNGNIALLGDAAHAMSPQLGQGANLALFDAMILAECMEMAHDIPHALEHYSQRRRKHLAYYQFVSRWLTPLFQSAITPLSWPRDWVFEPIARLPFFKQQVVSTLTGLKTGLLSNLPPDYAWVDIDL